MRRTLLQEKIERHERALSLGTVLSANRAAVIPPTDVIRVLNDASVDFVLMGAHAIGGWTDEPRATQDVDVLVKRTHHQKAVKAMRLAFPQLLVRDEGPVTRFVDPSTDKEVVDLMRPWDAIHQAVFDNCAQGGPDHRIPTLEMAIATKYAAMISPNRRTADKYQDAADFIRMIQFNHELDESKLRSLGELLHPGAGEELLNLAADAKADRRIEF